MDELRTFPWASILVLITSLSVLSKIVYDYATQKQQQTHMLTREEFEKRMAALNERMIDERQNTLEAVRQLIQDLRLTSRRGGQ